MRGGIRLAVFDLAGTTVEDSGGVMECFATSMETAGLRADREVLNERMGQSKLEVLRALADKQLGAGPRAEAAASSAFDLFRSCMAEIYRKGGARPIRGAQDVFAQLRGWGIRVVLNTGFDGVVTGALLGVLRWQALVDDVICIDDVPQGRPAPYVIHLAMQRTNVLSVHEAAVLGDTPSDIAAAVNAGARLAIGVQTGAHTAASLRRHPLTHLLEGVWELPALLSRLERLGPQH